MGDPDHVRGTLRISVFCPGSRFFGKERMALAAMKGLTERGHSVHCVLNAWNNGEFAGRLADLGIPMTRVHLGLISRTLKSPYVWWTINALIHLPGARRRCLAHLATFQPDAVLFYDWDWLVYSNPLVRNYRTFLYVHDLGISAAARGTRFNQWRLRRLEERVHTYIAVSESVRQRLTDIGVPESKIRLVYNGIESALPTNARSTSAERVRIGIVGQVGKWKGHDDLIEALRLLQSGGETFECVIIGTGEDDYVRSLQAKIAEYGLAENVRWLGYIRGSDAIFANVDICVAPSRWEEPFGLTAAEAGLRGIPVVAARSGALPEIVIDGKTGFVVDAGSPTQLAYRLRLLIREPELRRRLGSAARQRVLERFTEDRMISDIEKLCQATTTPIC